MRESTPPHTQAPSLPVRAPESLSLYQINSSFFPENSTARTFRAGRDGEIPITVGSAEALRAPRPGKLPGAPPPARARPPGSVGTRCPPLTPTVKRGAKARGRRGRGRDLWEERGGGRGGCGARSGAVDRVLRGLSGQPGLRVRPARGRAREVLRGGPPPPRRHRPPRPALPACLRFGPIGRAGGGFHMFSREHAPAPPVPGRR